MLLLGGKERQLCIIGDSLDMPPCGPPVLDLGEWRGHRAGRRRRSTLGQAGQQPTSRWHVADTVGASVIQNSPRSRSDTACINWMHPSWWYTLARAADQAAQTEYVEA
jgi:hypothetical protein